MKHLIEIPLANGETVIVEVDGDETSVHPITPRRGVREFVEEQIVERVGQTFEAALDKVRPAAAAIIGKHQDLILAVSRQDLAQPSVNKLPFLIVITQIDLDFGSTPR